MARVLVADDDCTVRSVLSQALSKAGFDVCQASDGREALDRYREEPADVAVVDMLMPGVDGIEVIRTLRRNPGNVKIIAMSSGGRIPAHEYLDWAEQIGADRVLQKPFRLADLVATVRDLIQE